MENTDVKMNQVKIGGRSFPLFFSLRALLNIQKRIQEFNINNIREITSTFGNMVKILYILAENAAKMNGTKLDVDEEWLELHIPPTNRMVIAIQLGIMKAITNGMNMESEQDEDTDREIDVVLREIQKKSEKTDSHGEKSQDTD